MGKTKTAFVPGVTEDVKSGAEKYQEKQAKKAQKESLRPEGPAARGIHIAGLKGGQRVKLIEAEPLAEQESTRVEEQEQGQAQEKDIKKVKKTKIRGKKYLALKAKVDRNKLYPVAEAVALVKETSFSKFDGAVELHLVVKNTKISAKITLPHPAGKAKKVEIADEKTIEKLNAQKIDFDVLLATPEMMPKLIPFAKLLGPKGLMPNPKNGTIIKDKSAASAIKSAQSLLLKTEKEAPLIHTVAGKVSQKEAELGANIKTILEGIGDKLIVKAFLKATMGPSVRIQV